MRLYYDFVLQCLKTSVLISTRHVAGRNNDIADALLRLRYKNLEDCPRRQTGGITRASVSLGTLEDEVQRLLAKIIG